MEPGLDSGGSLDRNGHRGTRLQVLQGTLTKVISNVENRVRHSWRRCSGLCLACFAAESMAPRCRCLCARYSLHNEIHESCACGNEACHCPSYYTTMRIADC